MQYGAGWRPRRSENLASRRPHGQHASLTLDADAPSLEGALSSSLSLVCHSPPEYFFSIRGVLSAYAGIHLTSVMPPEPFCPRRGLLFGQDGVPDRCYFLAPGVRPR